MTNKITVFSGSGLRAITDQVNISGLAVGDKLAIGVDGKLKKYASGQAVALCTKIYDTDITYLGKTYDKDDGLIEYITL